MEANKKKFTAHIILFIAFFIIAIIGLALSQVQIAFAETGAGSDLPIKGDLIFSLYTTSSGSQEYKVSAFNSDLTEAIIPEEFNGLPVTEVADNAFNDCQNLTYVLVPLSVKRVGNNAFSNCINLKTIHGMTNVETFGNFAFYNCKVLDNLILPAKVKKLGSNVIKNIPNRIYSRKSAEEMSALNEAWADNYSNILFGKAIACEEITINGVKGCAIIPYNSISSDEDYTLYSFATYVDTKGIQQTLPILEIASHAFAGCEFKSLTITNARPEDDHIINIRTNAFYKFKADLLTIDVGITLNDDSVENANQEESGFSTDVFTEATISEITLPTNDEFDRFPRSMFSHSSISKLKFDNTLDNHIARNIKRIDYGAFEKVFTLQEIYIPSTVNFVGENVFNFWGLSPIFNKYSINVDFAKKPDEWHSNWLGYTNKERVNVNYTQATNIFDITLDMDGGTGGSSNVSAEYGKLMPSAVAPVKGNYIFQGYFSGKNGTGIKYYNADMTSAQNWNFQSNGILYAYWKGIESKIYFDKMGGINGSDEITAEYGKTMPIVAAPSKTNYIFQGYFTEKNGEGTKYYDANMNSVYNWDRVVATTLYAYWLGVPSLIKFDQQAGVGGSQDAIAIYGNPMPETNNYGKLIAPTRQNYIFQGYFDLPYGKGTKYYDKDMKSLKDWDKSSEAILYADWKGVDCLIIFDKQGGFGGTDSISVEYGKILPQDLIAPKKSGFNFNGYYINEGNNKVFYYGKNMANSNKPWTITDNTVLYADWKAKELQIPLMGLENNKDVWVIFGQPMPYIQISYDTKKYELDGFYLNENGTGKKYYNGDMSSANIWDLDEAVPLYAHFSKKKYYLHVNPRPDFDFSYRQVVYYGEPLPRLDYPQRPDYEFAGYYTEPKGNGIQFYDENMETDIIWNFDSDMTLYAKWRVWLFQNIIRYVSNEETLREDYSFLLSLGDQVYFEAPNIEGYTFKCWKYGPHNTQWYQDLSSEKGIYIDGREYCSEYGGTINYFYAIYEKACVAEGALITLADGSQVPVEQLTGNEQLLVWNLKTGAFDTAPILFIDHDIRMNYEVINLEFSDGTTVKVISEHAFWDFDLNEYVFLRRDAAQYIGHWFNRQTLDSEGNMTWTKVQLTSVTVRDEYTSAWSPVTYSHLCYYVNGMLSMPGATEGLINIFDVDGETMKYDEESYQADLEKYGTFTYEEFVELFPVPREIFDAFNGEYIKVSLGKGLITKEQLGRLIESYAKFFM